MNNLLTDSFIKLNNHQKVFLFKKKYYLCGVKYGGWNTPPTFELKNYNMKRVTIRKDLMKKQNYAKHYCVSRPTLDKMISDGLVSVEHIDGTDYIVLPR